MYQAKQAGKGCIRFNPNAQFRINSDPKSLLVPKQDENSVTENVPDVAAVTTAVAPDATMKFSPAAQEVTGVGQEQN